MLKKQSRDELTRVETFTVSQSRESPEQTGFGNKGREVRGGSGARGGRGRERKGIYGNGGPRYFFSIIIS